MNHSQADDYIEPYRKISRFGDDLEKLIVEALASANFSVDVAIQELRLPRIAAALVARHKAGVKVRVILENNYSTPWSEINENKLGKLTERERDRYAEYRRLADANGDNKLTPEEIKQGDALVMLRDAGIPVIDDTADGSKGSGLMHHKFVIIDGKRLIITSANFTSSDLHGDFKFSESRGNANNLLKIESSELAAIFAEEFALMWGDGVGGKQDSKFGIKKPFRGARQVRIGSGIITVQFSPTEKKVLWEESTNGAIAKTLNKATQSIDMALFVFSEQRIVNTLERLHQRGVKLRALIEPSFAYRSYSEALDMMGVTLFENCKYEANNKPWQNPISTVGVPNLPAGDFLHHKFAVVDRQIVLTGSHNWSVAANNNNDETLLVIENPTVAAHFLREFERLYAGAQLGITASLQAKIKERQEQCRNSSISRNLLSEDAINKSSTKIQNSTLKPQHKVLVNLNTATLEEIEALPGVGSKLAQRIVEARQQKPFASLEDLQQVPGVGPKLLEKLRDRVTW
ncbi:MAG TPA: DUF655 domain-containing protein [Oscillatoriaceae cyanobacterium M7585_C2015_266]|nr:DUF655 domain-containing protein [Oscillatoriaceae cyanobacterium M7585_C2015_266]